MGIHTQSRRIAVTTGGNTTSFIYDGFNCIAEYTGTTLSKTRLWGLDLSGSMQGAGGVGGLLAEKQGSNSYYPLFDGNGNITEYINSTGSVEVRFEYDPFGNTVVNTDSGNLFYYRFSTKPLDFTTGLYYYQYRWYDPATGRWPSRDPIEEMGGVNLYGFVGNDGVDRWDHLGLSVTIDDGGNFHVSTPAHNCCIDDNGNVVPGVKDDAGAECCPNEISDVELRAETGLIGHSWIAMDNGSYAWGHYPKPKGSSTADEWYRSYVRPGQILDDSKRSWNRKKIYKACPLTKKLLKLSIDMHKDDAFSLSNRGARNCFGWALERLEDAGFKPTPPSNTPKISPSDLK